LHRSSIVGLRGIKLYVTEYFTVPPVTSLGTFIERNSVEFCPFMGGSGKREKEVREKRAVGLEQSVTEAWADPRRKKKHVANNIYIHATNCFMPYACKYN
jgi:hypothetical protein